MKLHKLVPLAVLILVAGASLPFVSNSASAKVTGPCANCHTMHNSQGGSPVAVGGAGTGWDAGGNLVGTAQTTASASLTISDCVGCHSSTTSDTIVDLGGNRIPIVYNTVTPANPLAGGNFYWVVANGDAYGHNVYGISGEDATLSEAPGNTHGCSGKGCHNSLARDGSDTGSMFYYRQGCQGCHFEISHHDSGTFSTPTSAYRFLEGHDMDCYVIGKEDDDWEYTKSASDHNEYKGDPNDWGTGSSSSDLSASHNLSAYCKGCHTNFHAQSDGSSWIRHPSDAVLPTTGEYAAYTTYDPIAPIARPDPNNVIDPSVVTPGTDMVMCLSCHRPHGSPYPDILRWDYTAMNAGGGGADGTGCFVCHTNKDGS